MIAAPSAVRAGARLESIPCAFCGGTGHDPFNILSHLSTCCVCGGRGDNAIHAPHVRCAFCDGTGVYPGTGLTCTACNGRGRQTVPKANATCRHCGGRGVNPDTGASLYCPTCHGAGVAMK